MCPPEIACSEQMHRFETGERFIRSWRQPDRDPQSGSNHVALVLIHGLGDHSGRYDEMARWFAARGVSVYACDLLGHGQSPGARMVIPNYEALLQDVENLYGYVRDRHSDSRLGLFGQSMGGNLVLNHQLRGYSQPEFVIAGSPMLRAVNPPGAISMILLRLISHVRPNLRLKGDIDASDLSRDPAMQQAFLDDPLVQRGITLQLGRVLIDSGEWAIGAAHKIPSKTLVMHGTDDRITSHEASLEFAEKSMGKVTTRIWPGAKHDLHHDIAREEYFASILDWISKIEQE